MVVELRGAPERILPESRLTCPLDDEHLRAGAQQILEAADTLRIAGANQDRDRPEEERANG
jgi:hypothetical protein